MIKYTYMELYGIFFTRLWKRINIIFLFHQNVCRVVGLRSFMKFYLDILTMYLSVYGPSMYA